MRVVLRQPGGDREVDVALRNPEATLQDVLRAALVERIPETVAIDGRAVPASARVHDAGLHEAAVLALSPNGGTPAPRAGLELVVLTGLDAGRALSIRAGRWSIGREAGNAIVIDDETISRTHCELEIDERGAGTVTDLGSANGTLVDGDEATEPTAIEPGTVIQAGAVAFVLREAADDRPLGLDVRRHVGASGAIAFNRPPRLAGAAPPAPLDLPSEPGDPPPAHFSIATTVGPLVLAVVMVAITRDIRFALFSLLSPVIGIGTYVESRRRNTKTRVDDQRKYTTALRELSQRVRDAGELERARRRERTPDPAEVLRRAALPSMRLWERRPQHDDFLSLYAGLGDIAWEPPVESRAGKPPEKVAAALAGPGLRAAPVSVELSRGGVVGIVGDRPAALATARSLLCQAAVHHGPADLTIGVFADEGREPDWEWSKWLPHTRSADGDDSWLSARRERSEALLRRLLAGAATGTILAVLDSDLLIEGRNSPARELLAGPRRPDSRGDDRLPVAGIVVSSSRDRLPAACTTVIELVSADGDAVLHRTESGDGGQELIVAGLAPATARACARDLARFEDPELRQVGAGLPDSVRLLPLLELDGVNADAVRRRWKRSGMPARPAAPLGVTEQGVFTLDLERDGPHGLVGGTTGSGKSELLRSLIAALAANADPRQLTFLLMDFKGGAAFDACARLPHTVGMVTDLDEGLVDRALRALEAELQYRERLLRDAGADNLRAYHERDHDEPLPRLVVVIDEFAKMAREQPELLAALVDVAQRGRTLGVHLILATQRPAGVVNDHIRTNTNLRIALRVQDAEDSLDVIGERAAAELSRHRPGRAYFRLGPDEVVPIQTALATCVTDATSDAAVEVTAFEFGAAAPERGSGDVVERADQPSDLARLVDAIIEANAAEGIPPARKPWPEPLPAQIDLAELVNGDRALVALADEPRRQTQYPVGWELGEGNLLLFGIPGSGTTTALASLVLSLAGLHAPEALEVYALDFGAGDLRALEALPHTGSVVLAGDRERQMRLIRRLRRELDERRLSGGGALTVVVIDNLAALRAEFDDPAGMELMDALSRVYADGPQVGIHLAVTADRANTVPTAWMANTTQKWLFRLADRYDYVSLGLTVKDVPPALPGRAVMAGTGLQIQVGRPQPSLADAAAMVAGRHVRSTPVATPVGVLPAEVELSAAAHVADEPWRIPIGMRESDLTVAELVLYEGEHAIVAGPARSGRSLTLWTIAEALRRAGAGLLIAAVAGRRSPLPGCPALDHVAAAAEAGAMLAQLRVHAGPIVLLVDDAEGIDDADGAIGGLLGAGRPDLHVVAAARADSLRTLYGHWTKEIQRSKAGILLRPNIDYDGELVGATLPRRAPVQMVTGRGYLAHNGELEIVQVAKPAST